MYLIDVIQLADPVRGGKGLGVRVLHLAVSWIELDIRLLLLAVSPLSSRRRIQKAVNRFSPKNRNISE